MIPHVIHYCWFGGRPLPESARQCLRSWQRWLPGCEIRRWDESNYDINAVTYTRQAAEREKWAFVSDYTRFDILYRHGGIYFDTDVEVIAPFDGILSSGPFMGWEKSPAGVGVNPGLGMGAEAGMSLYAEVLAHYAVTPFVDNKGAQIPGTVVRHVTDILLGHGLELTDTVQKVDGVTIYPSRFFNPFDDATGRLTITPDTRSIHRFDKSWCDGYGPVRMRVSRMLHRYFGTEIFARIRRLTGI